MGANEAHGVVVVRVSQGTIHRIETGSEVGGHGIGTLQTDDWELFPNVVMAMESEGSYELCQLCFQFPRPRWLTVRR